jgi:hypothetical protein
MAWKQLDQVVKGVKYSRIKDLYQMTELTFFDPPQARVRSSWWLLKL